MLSRFCYFLHFHEQADWKHDTKYGNMHLSMNNEQSNSHFSAVIIVQSHPISNTGFNECNLEFDNILNFSSLRFLPDIDFGILSAAK